MVNNLGRKFPPDRWIAFFLPPVSTPLATPSVQALLSFGRFLQKLGESAEECRLLITLENASECDAAAGRLKAMPVARGATMWIFCEQLLLEGPKWALNSIRQLVLRSWSRATVDRLLSVDEHLLFDATESSASRPVQP